MRIRAVSVVVSLIVCAALASGARAQIVSGGNLPEYVAADPDAPVVTQQNLLASERFWPYRVTITQPVPDVAHGTLKIGTRGVLVRVEEGGVARIDFGRHGQHEVPVGKTDLVERANRIRTGELEKAGPNLAVAIGPRLRTLKGKHGAQIPFEEVRRKSGFLCVFADPQAEGVEELVEALAPLADRPDVMTVLFAQGRPADATLIERLSELGWSVPVVPRFLVDGYTRSLLGEKVTLPTLLLQTNEGRVLYRADGWDGERVPKALMASLEKAFGSGVGAVASTGSDDLRLP
jgi:hypothetical protein